MNSPPCTYNVLFLCTGNSARSILAEAILKREGRGRFHAFSAGSHPKGSVHPMTLEVLNRHDFPTAGLRSKSWDEYAKPDAPIPDFIFTVCDDAAGEVCPIWPGKPTTAHWGIEDPAAVDGPGQKAAFERALVQLNRRISLFLSLPIGSIDGLSLQNRLRDIGRTEDAEPTIV